MPRAKRPASAVWLRWWRQSGDSLMYTQAQLAALLRHFGYRCSARTVRRWERLGPPAWVRRVLDGERR